MSVKKSVFNHACLALHYLINQLFLRFAKHFSNFVLNFLSRTCSFKRSTCCPKMRPFWIS